MRGSLRQRSGGSWELRVYVGTDPETGRRVDRSVTVRGSRAEAERELAAMVASVRCAGAGCGTTQPRSHRIAVITTEPSPPTPEELWVLLDHVAERDPQLHAFLVLAAVTGARRAQLLGLRGYNVHHATCAVSFCSGWFEGPHGPVLAATKTKRRHVVDLDPDSFAVLAAHAQRHATRRDGFVFSDDGGHTAWKPNRASKAFLRHRRAAGLRPFCLRDLRHFMATEMLQAGVPLVVVSRRLDHHRRSTTLDKYAHAVPGGDADASATLWQILRGPVRHDDEPTDLPGLAS